MSRLPRPPWWLKIAAKLVLARLPLPTAFWRQVKLFRHGAMDDPAYALRIFRHHYARSGELPAGWICLELGPGDSLLTALIAKAYGAGQVWLVDAGNFASTEITGFIKLAGMLKADGLNVPEIKANMSVADVLALCNARYLVNGLAGLRTIPDASADFIFSNAVLEHVRAHEFAATLHELKRIMKPDGTQSHAIDLKDHLATSLNNLRFSPALWEKDWFAARSGFYTNRLRHSEIMSILNTAGYRVDEVTRTTWPALPLTRTKMHESFKRFDDTDHCISEFEIVLR